MLAKCESPYKVCISVLNYDCCVITYNLERKTVIFHEKKNELANLNAYQKPYFMKPL